MDTFKQLPKNIKIAFVVLLIVAIGAIIALGVFLKSSHNTTGSVDIKAIDVKSVVSDVGKAIILPEGETPNISAVADVSALKNEPFFANAETGDLVVVYPSTRRAILWRPSVKKIVEISIVNVSQ